MLNQTKHTEGRDDSDARTESFNICLPSLFKGRWIRFEYETIPDLNDLLFLKCSSKHIQNSTVHYRHVQFTHLEKSCIIISDVLTKLENVFQDGA